MVVKKADVPVARLYGDADVDARLVKALQPRSLDVATTGAAGLLHTSDEELVAYAARHQRALVTHHVTHVPRVHATWIAAGWEHGGIIMLIGHAAVGAWRRRMEVLLQCFSAEELYNQWLFLGAAYEG